MNFPWQLIILLPVLLGTLLGSQMHAMKKRLKQLANISLSPLRPKDGLLNAKVQATVDTHRWAASERFDFVGYFETLIDKSLITIAVWKSKTAPTFLCHNVSETCGAYSFVSCLRDSRTVSTCSTTWGFWLPEQIGCYTESFPEADLDELWSRHTKTQNYLIQSGGARLQEPNETFDIFFCQHIHKQIEHIFEISLWDLRAVWWFYFRERHWQNLSVEQQHGRGLIKLPNEMSQKMVTVDKRVDQSCPDCTNVLQNTEQFKTSNPLAIVEGRTDPGEIADLLAKSRQPSIGSQMSMEHPIEQNVTNEGLVFANEQTDQATGSSETSAAIRPEGSEQQVSEEDLVVANVNDELTRQTAEEKSWIKELGIIALSLIAFIALGFFRFSLINIGILVLVIFVHELGHAVGMRLFGYRDVSMMFIPLFGGLATGRESNPSGARKAIVSLLGPGPGIFLGMGFAIAYFITLQDVLSQLAWAFLLINFFNLLPFYPLDGARVLEHAVFSRRPRIELGFKLITGGLLALLALQTQAIVFLFLSIIILLSLRSTYRTAKIATDIRCSICADEQLDTKQIPKKYLLEIIRFFRAQAGGANKSVKALVSLSKTVWLRVCNRQPSATMAILLILLYLWIVLFSLGTMGGFITGARQAGKAIENGVSQPRLAWMLVGRGIASLFLLLMAVVSFLLVKAFWKVVIQRVRRIKDTHSCKYDH